jgi:ribonuclease T2
MFGQQFSYADYNIQGSFAAGGCTAYSSIKNQNEPVGLEAGVAYQATGLNKQDGDFVAIKVNGKTKWVAKSCGTLALNDANAPAIAPIVKPNISQPAPVKPSTDTAQSCPAKGCADKYLLSLSWQSSFCQTHPTKAECIKQSADGYDATNFTLHGLWPDKLSYCGVASADINNDESHNWDQLPPVNTDAQTHQDLTVVMPGIISDLDRHEWYKHGTCDGRSSDQYYDIAINLLKEFNGSKVRDLFATNIGKTINFEQVKQTFDSSFGEGASNSLNLKCGKEDGLLSEIRLKIKRPLEGQKLAEVLLPSGGLSCDRVIVDAVGL